MDREIQQTGFVPGKSYGLAENGSVRQNDRNSNLSTKQSENANSNGNGKVRWSCSEKQKEFIGRLIAENDLDPASVDEIALNRFSVGFRHVNKVQASALISELLDLCGQKSRPANDR